MSKVKILYVEDELFLGKIVKESLESRNYQVNMITDGIEVIAAYKNFQPDICILDVMLPNRDGFSLGKEIRASNPAMPIIYLTAKNQTEDILKGFKSGGNDYIRKPFSMEELIVRVKNLLALTNTQAEALPVDQVIRLGNYHFHPLKYELKLKEQIQRLSHRETQLMSIFAEHINLPVSRKDILLNIWGDDSFFNSRNLDVYIKKLRNYLKEDPKVRIVTLKGVGYHFVIESV